jgi:hypothetical protein
MTRALDHDQDLTTLSLAGIDWRVGVSFNRSIACCCCCLVSQHAPTNSNERINLTTFESNASHRETYTHPQSYTLHSQPFNESHQRPQLRTVDDHR